MDCDALVTVVGEAGVGQAAIRCTRYDESRDCDSIVSVNNQAVANECVFCTVSLWDRTESGGKGIIFSIKITGFGIGYVLFYFNQTYIRFLCVLSGLPILFRPRGCLDPLFKI